MKARWFVKKFPWIPGDWTLCVHWPPHKIELFQEDAGGLNKPHEPSGGYDNPDADTGWNEEFSSREITR